MKVDFHLVGVLFSSIAVLSCAGHAQVQIKATAAITGTVHDGSGNGVNEASVRLQGQGSGRAEERKTDASGSFGFSGLSLGTYFLSASKGERHSSEVTVSLTKDGAVQHVDLTLLSSNEGGQKLQMEYSDVQSFSVAAVTDWTAAGGHGSDSSLRTSEALNRQTLRLKTDVGHASSADPGESEQTLRSALEKSPRDLKANEDLGRLYLALERYSDAVQPLQTAVEIDKNNEKNEIDLTVALVRSGSLTSAREHIMRRLSKGAGPEWHRIAGEIAEKSGDPLNAVREFELAAKAEPSEENYFAWGSELLEHRAIWQAKDVFESGAKAFPNSARMLTALGAALFGGARYEESARRLCEASDLKPTDPEPYLFMGKVEVAAPNPLPCIETKLQRFVQMQPTNPTANLYYATSYWKEHGRRIDAETVSIVETYLNRAVKADPKCSEAHLQLGKLKASRGDFASASESYRRAIDSDPQSTEAHYRLGVAYDRLGQKDHAAEEFRLHDELEKEHAAAVDRQRKEVKQFLVQVRENVPERSARP